MASRKSAASVETNTSQNAILMSNISDDIIDDQLFLYLDNLTELDGKNGDYTITRNDHSQIVVSFKTTVALASEGSMYVLCIINILTLATTYAVLSDNFTTANFYVLI